jgi:hypothetical protein
MLGATASVQVALASPFAVHWFGTQPFLSLHIAVPVPAYAPFEQVQV